MCAKFDVIFVRHHPSGPRGKTIGIHEEWPRDHLIKPRP